MGVLRGCKNDIGWTISNLKGTSLSIFIDKIIIEDGAKRMRDVQKRLNPILIEVVKKKVLKWFAASIIYCFLDSKYASPIQCVPKKRGVIVITKEKNEFIPT